MFPMSDGDWFWKQLTVTANGCREWPRHRNKYGYGVVKRAAFRDWPAHRVAWVLANGSIPDGMRILHRCDNPPCCEPAHLFVGTTGDNNRDAVGKGRQRHGEGHWARRDPARWETVRQLGTRQTTKLDPAKVRAIRAARADGQPIKLIAEQYGISVSQAANVIHRRRWAHVD